MRISFQAALPQETTYLLLVFLGVHTLIHSTLSLVLYSEMPLPDKFKRMKEKRERKRKMVEEMAKEEEEEQGTQHGQTNKESGIKGKNPNVR